MKENKLLIAAAGAGKTTFLVEEAYKRKENVLITTFTLENEAEIHDKFIKKYGLVPGHVTIQTWFSFLFQHGVKPYQGSCYPELYEKKINGIQFVDEASGIKYKRKSAGREIPVPYNEEEEFMKHYFSSDLKLYADKLAKFVIRANEKSQGEIFSRIARLFPTIYIDEVQDLCGHDLEIIKELYRCDSTVICVGDPRQVTYYTHWETKNSSYKNGQIKKYVEEKCRKRDKIIVDETSLSKSHRNNKQICAFSSSIYPSMPPVEPCQCTDCHPKGIVHQGVFIVKQGEVNQYLQKYSPIQLRHSIKKQTDDRFLSYNYGQSKGKTYDRVLIYPTNDIKKWISNRRTILKDKTRAGFYVAVTRARYSVAFVLPDEDCFGIDDIEIWNSVEDE